MGQNLELGQNKFIESGKFIRILTSLGRPWGQPA
jgi:hypothetical protein